MIALAIQAGSPLTPLTLVRITQQGDASLTWRSRPCLSFAHLSTLLTHHRRQAFTTTQDFEMNSAKAKTYTEEGLTWKEIETLPPFHCVNPTDNTFYKVVSATMELMAHSATPAEVTYALWKNVLKVGAHYHHHHLYYVQDAY